MDERIQEMLDHYEITKLLSVYCHGCDRLDGERMGSVYTKSSWDDHGPNKCDGKEFAGRAMKSLGANTNECTHQLGQTLINVTGDTAGAETYFIASLRRNNPEGGEFLDQMGGRYLDKLEREDGKWKIKDRLCVREWSISLPVEKDWLEGQGFVEGQRSFSDRSYSLLGIEKLKAAAE